MIIFLIQLETFYVIIFLFRYSSHIRLCRYLIDFPLLNLVPGNLIIVLWPIPGLWIRFIYIFLSKFLIDLEILFFI